jgi:hypothetical protein
MIGGLLAGVDESPGEKFYMKVEALNYTVEWDL